MERSTQGIKADEYGPSASYDSVVNEVRRLHTNKQDFADGDLLHRISRFDRYVMTAVPVERIDLFEFALDEDTVLEFMTQFRATGAYPRIVFDAVDGSMIDGIRRANALVRCGLSEIDAFVGIHANLDPDWHPQCNDDDFLEDSEDEGNSVVVPCEDRIASSRTLVRPR